MTSPDTESDLQALERFVVENDDLLDLEARIGRFNIFDALGIARAEIRHSNFLAWLLDPAESHGQGGLFLKAFLMDLLKQAPPDQRPFSPVELDGEDLRGIEVRREWRHIDLLIRCEEPPFVIAIENKVDAGLYNDFDRYEDAVNAVFRNRPRQFVLLTRDGDDPPDEDWVPYSYADLHRVLKRTRDAHADSIGDDVLAFLDHYLNLIGTRFMDDPKIDELCQRIYRNHRQALELIYERAGTPASGVITEIEQMLEAHPGDWEILSRRGTWIEFVPKDWRLWLPRLGVPPLKDPQIWIYWWLYVDDQRCRMIIEVGPLQDVSLRRQLIETLSDSNELPCVSYYGRTFKDVWTRIYRKDVLRWTNGDMPEPERIAEAAGTALDQAIKRLKPLPDILRPILTEWQAKQNQSA